MADSSLPVSAAIGTATAAEDGARAKDTAHDQPKDAVKMDTIDPNKQAKKEVVEDEEEAKDIRPTSSTSKGKQPATAADLAASDHSDEQPAEPTPTTEEKGKQKAPDPEDTIDPAPDASNNPTDTPATTQLRTCMITLLLATGARHPYRIDEKYLQKMDVETPDKTEDGRPDPFSISVYKLKELIFRAWRDEWEARPRDPSLIRLIHFGKLLEDKEQLSKYNFKEAQSNIVHMTIRPADLVEEDEAAKAAGGNRVHRDYPRSGCCCVIL